MKNLLNPIKLIDAGDTSGNLTSSVVDCRYQDNLAFQAIWTNTTTGSITIEVSVDKSNWSTYPISPTVSPAGSANSAVIEIKGLVCPWARVKFTQSAGSGALTVWLCAKSDRG